MEEVLKQILNKLDIMEGKVNKIDNIEKELKEIKENQNSLKEEQSIFKEEINKRLNRVEFEFIDTRVTLKNEIIPTLVTIAENQERMFTCLTNLVTTTESIKQDVAVISEHVRRHEDKLESLT
ncbi:MAG: hypothetical protein ABRQ37_21540 [Candidatus Eremiobacterota bacterium]